MGGSSRHVGCVAHVASSLIASNHLATCAHSTQPLLLPLYVYKLPAFVICLRACVVSMSYACVSSFCPLAIGSAVCPWLVSHTLSLLPFRPWNATPPPPPTQPKPTQGELAHTWLLIALRGTTGCHLSSLPRPPGSSLCDNPCLCTLAVLRSLCRHTSFFLLPFSRYSAFFAGR